MQNTKLHINIDFDQLNNVSNFLQNKQSVIGF